MKKIIAVIFTAFTSLSLQAGFVSAEISSLLFYEAGNLLYIYPVGGTGALGKVSCHGGNGDYIVYKMDRPRAKEYIAALNMAFAANKRVEFWYEDACRDQSVAVTLRYFRVQKN